jgi:Tfp pilus assembly protein PilF/TolB-like protein
MRAEAQGLLAVATSIADGQEVDWQLVEAGLDTERERALLRSLRVIASIGAVHRTADSDRDDSMGLSALGRRARVVGRIGPPGFEASGEDVSAADVAQAQAGAAVSPSPSSADAASHEPAIDSVPATPERWGTLTIRERVGGGVFGDVYRAYDEQLQREVALKLLGTRARSSDAQAAKILHEGRLLARLRHPNVVLVHGVEARGDRVGLWMEFIRGCTLEQLLERQGLFGAREAVLIGQDLCRALAAVHAAGLVHRDVKAQNVMREEGGRVVLMDFGTGVPVRDDETGLGARAAGTPLYLAPELLDSGEATASSDLYSLGVLLFHLVTRTYPVTATSLPDLRAAHRRGRRRLEDVRADLPDAFLQVVDRALAPSPADRYASAGAMQDGLTRALGVDTPASASAPAVQDRPVGDAPRTLVDSGDARATPMPVGSGRRIGLWIALGLVLATALAGWMTRSFWRAPAAAPIQSVVVLPLANVSSGDRDLAEGINLLIGERLSTLPGLRVVQYTASMASRDKGLPVSEIIRRAQSDAAITGSVTWSGARAHVFLQLVRAGTSAPTWVKQMEVPARRAAELPRTVGREVAGALAVKLSATEELALSGTDASAPEAFEAYLRARVNMRAATAPAVALAIAQLEDALRLDPQHAPSLAALADCYIVQGVSQRTRPLAQAGVLAREAATRALALDSQLPEAHQALAEVRFYIDWDWAGTEQAYKRAIEFRPNSGEVRARYAMFLASRKRLTDAMQEVHQAVAIDPMSPLANASLGMLWHYARSDDQAERIYRGVLEADPTFPPARLGLIRTYVSTRRFEWALKELERNRIDARGELSPGQQSMMALAYVGLGRTAEAAEIAERLVVEERELPSVDAATVLIALDQHDRALEILERAVELKSPKVLFLRLDPRFDALLHHERFRRLLRRMGFPS